MVLCTVRIVHAWGVVATERPDVLLVAVEGRPSGSTRGEPRMTGDSVEYEADWMVMQNNDMIDKATVHNCQYWCPIAKQNTSYTWKKLLYGSSRNLSPPIA